MDSQRSFRKTWARWTKTIAPTLLLAGLLAAWAQSAPPLPAPESYGGTWVFDDQGGIIRDKPIVSMAVLTISGGSISGTLTIGAGTDTVGAPVKNVLGSEIGIRGSRDPETKTLVAFKYSGDKLKGNESSIRFEGDTAVGNIVYEDGPFLGIQFTLKRGGPAPPPPAAATAAMLLDANPHLIETTINSLMEPLPFKSDSELKEVLPKLLDASKKLARRGTAADGLSMLLVVRRYSSAGKAVFQLPEGRDMGGLLAPVNLLKPDFTLWRKGQTSGGSTVTVDTVEQGSNHYAVALYMPPARFDDALSRGRTILFDLQGEFDASLAPNLPPPGPGTNPGSGIAARQVDVAIEFRSDTNAAHNAVDKQPIEVVRPPVMLVHGTYDAPYECWDTQWLGGKTMVQRLQEHGFYVSLVDFRTTNGRHDRRASGFNDNAQVLWLGKQGPDRTRDDVVAGRETGPYGPVHCDTGGMMHVQTAFRKNGFAVTQSDVTAHSLGGVLSRVAASKFYNPDYERNANFGQGYIRRLITVSSTHFGSDIERSVLRYTPFAMQLMHQRTSGKWNAVGNLSREDQVLGSITPALVDYTAGTMTGAFEDQTPGSPGLRNIGETRVPAHAIACVCSSDDLDGVAKPVPPGAFDTDQPGDELLKELEGFEDSYRRRLGAAFFLTPDEVFIQSLPTQKDDAERMIVMRDSLENDFSDYVSYRERLVNFGPAAVALKDTPRPIEEALRKAVVQVTLSETGKRIPHPFFNRWTTRRYWELVRMYRAMVFGNCENDCTVRLQSSLCGLEVGSSGTTVLKSVLHGYAPAYQSVKNRVVELLRGDLKEFRDGFPEAGQDFEKLELNKPLDAGLEMTPVTMPLLRGLEVSDAIAELVKPDYRDVDLEMAIVSNSATSGIDGPRRISRQDQPQGVRVLRGAAVRVHVD